MLVKIVSMGVITENRSFFGHQDQPNSHIWCHRSHVNDIKNNLSQYDWFWHLMIDQTCWSKFGKKIVQKWNAQKCIFKEFLCIFNEFTLYNEKSKETVLHHGCNTATQQMKVDPISWGWDIFQRSAKFNGLALWDRVERI